MPVAWVYTCPTCRSIVDYSCQCEDEPGIDGYIGHDSVEAAKAHVAEMRGMSLASATHIEVEAHVRYWEDASINGVGGVTL